MNLIDNNALDHIFEHNILCKNNYFLCPDVVEEANLTLEKLGQSLPKGIQPITESSTFNELQYIGFYKKMLNKHGGWSIYNMTGFGDISILATAHTILSTSQRSLFEDINKINIFTNDNRLTNRIQNEFKSQQVKCFPIEEVN